MRKCKWRLAGAVLIGLMLGGGTAYAEDLVEIFKDEFSSNTLTEYVVNKSTNYATVSYDSANQQLKLTTGDNVNINIDHSLPVTADAGYFEYRFFPFRVWPFDGLTRIYAIAGENSYYNFHFAHDSGVPFAGDWNQYRARLEKVVNGQIVFQKIFVPTPTSYALNAWHTIALRFSPESATGYLDGNQIVTLVDPTAQKISVNKIRLDFPQQDQYVDNIRCLVELPNAAPSAVAGPNMFITSEVVAATILHGQASDPDGDILTYRWKEGSSELMAYAPVGPNGEADLPLSSVSQFSIGPHMLTLEVSDGLVTATNQMVLTVANAAPVAAINGSATIQLGDSLALAGTASDFDGDRLIYRWLEAGAVLDTGTVDTLQGGLPVAVPEIQLSGLALGEHEITLEVIDGINPPFMANANVTVIDTLAPTLNLTTTSSLLWPPNHKLVDVVISAQAADNSGNPVLLEASATSSEFPDTAADGSTIPDIVGPAIDQNSGLITFQLRAERAGNGTGRVYTVVITATDESGNSSVAFFNIRAPRDMGSL